MANFVITTATGNKTFSSTEAVVGIETTDVKVMIGAPGTASHVSDANPIPAKGQPLSPFRSVTITDAATLVIASAVQLRALDLFNRGAGELFFHLYNAASAGAIIVGTTSPYLTYPMLPESGWSKSWSPDGISFPAGIVIAVTTAISGASGAVNSGDVICNLGYR